MTVRGDGHRWARSNLVAMNIIVLVIQNNKHKAAKIKRVL